MSTNYTELSKRASDLMVSGADPAVVNKAYDEMMAAKPGAEQRALAVSLRESVASNMDRYAALRKRDGETRLDSYCRLLAEDELMGQFYKVYVDAEQFLA